MGEIRILGIVPARAGSKGVPNKNIRPLHGRPLLHWAAEALLNAQGPDTCLCSTDSEIIADCARDIGLEVPWLRPAELAADESSTVSVIEHALTSYQQQGEHFSHVVLIQPTSPTVLSKDIERAIQLAIDEKADTVITGFHSTHVHPSLMYSINSAQQVEWLLPASERKSRRQEFSRIFIRTGLVYVARTQLILEHHSLYGERIVSLEIPERRSLTIDTEEDFLSAEKILEQMTHEG